MVTASENNNKMCSIQQQISDCGALSIFFSHLRQPPQIELSSTYRGIYIGTLWHPHKLHVATTLTLLLSISFF